MGRDGIRVPRDRRASGCRGREPVGARAGARLQLGHASGGVMATPEVIRDAVLSFDLASASVRDLTQPLHAPGAAATGGRVRVLNPGGKHAIAVGLDAPYGVEIEGHVGYYAAGMNKQATIRIRGNCGVGVAENMMSGSVIVEGSASQSAGASA